MKSSTRACATGRLALSTRLVQQTKLFLRESTSEAEQSASLPGSDRVSSLAVIGPGGVNQVLRRCIARWIRCARNSNVEMQSRSIRINQERISQSRTLPGWLKDAIARKAKKAISVMLPHSTNLFPELLLNVRQKNARYPRKTNKVSTKRELISGALITISAFYAR